MNKNSLIRSQFLGEKYYRIGNASYQLGVYIQTLRKGIYSVKIKTLRTTGGEHRIPESELRHILNLTPQQEISTELDTLIRKLSKIPVEYFKIQK